MTEIEAIRTARLLAEKFASPTVQIDVLSVPTIFPSEEIWVVGVASSNQDTDPIVIFESSVMDETALSEKVIN